MAEVGAPPKHGLVLRVDAKGYFVLVFKRLYPKNMVEMTMGIDDGDRLQSAGRQVSIEPGLLPLVIHAGVHNPTAFFIVNNKVAVLLEGIKRKSLYMKHGVTIFFCKFKRRKYARLPNG
jgi:hypothetical protein